MSKNVFKIFILLLIAVGEDLALFLDITILVIEEDLLMNHYWIVFLEKENRFKILKMNCVRDEE